MWEGAHIRSPSVWPQGKDAIAVVGERSNGLFGLVWLSLKCLSHIVVGRMPHTCEVTHWHGVHQQTGESPKKITGEKFADYAETRTDGCGKKKISMLILKHYMARNTKTISRFVWIKKYRTYIANVNARQGRLWKEANKLMKFRVEYCTLYILISNQDWRNSWSAL